MANVILLLHLLNSVELFLSIFLNKSQLNSPYTNIQYCIKKGEIIYLKDIISQFTKSIRFAFGHV